MKKVVLCIVALLFSCSVVFCADAEGWNSFGIGYESTVQFGKSGDGIIHSVGVPIHAYQFWNGKDYGMMVNGNVSFPVATTAAGVTMNASDWDFGMKINLIIGAGFKTKFSRNLLTHYGVGFALSETVIRTSKYAATMGLDLGIGVDLGVKYDFSDIVGIDIGCVAVVNFAEWSMVNTAYGKTSGFAKGYFGVDMRPYISCSINYFRTSDGTKFGKKSL